MATTKLTPAMRQVAEMIADGLNAYHGAWSGAKSSGRSRTIVRMVDAGLIKHDPDSWTLYTLTTAGRAALETAGRG